ncbi:Transcriptional regulator [Flavobacterium sp. 9AF]|uniref:DUF6377 domain-containing protein n=1 Tax=Flavobacterium sp. 9AF TaxID=2653142 RepID=UPI0012F3DD12|nr:DUF6377 domain-containing protein [Flavobacterium sp. 9AF]VXB70646.1 Transcriptional regulator [Flavobacterium sp. 9AF]
MNIKSLILLLIVIFNNIHATNVQTDSLISVLENEIQLSKKYVASKENKIKNLISLLEDEKANLNNQYFIISKIIDEYQYYSFDKALNYTEKNLNIALKLKDQFKILESKLKLGRLLVDSGRYKESLDILKGIESKKLNAKLLREYYFIHKEAYSGLSFYTMVKNRKTDYNTLYYKYEDSLSKKLKKSSFEILSLLEKKYRDNRETEQALDINSKRLRKCKMGTREFSLVTFERSLLYHLYNDTNNQKKYLCLSAISDIRSNVKDNASLTELAMILYSESDIERAHKFITFSMDDAKFYNSHLRFVNISTILPAITMAYENRINDQKSALKNFIILISALGIILLIVVFYIFKQNKKLSLAKNNLNEVNEKLKNLNKELNFSNNDLSKITQLLAESNDIKEHYIATFLNLYSEYIDKLDIYRKLVTKYIITNKTNELLDLTKSKQVIDNELKIFYKNFDESFLHIYPNFIQQFNDLLKENEKIAVKNSEELLNTELRIYALIRLGITNSAKISKILRYSVNTIYNYRVKIKNSAINRSEFENLVKKIE